MLSFLTLSNDGLQDGAKEIDLSRTPTIKNTFLDFGLTPTSVQQRSQSVPASARLCLESDNNEALAELIRTRRELQARDEEICRLRAEVEQARLKQASDRQTAERNASKARSEVSTDAFTDTSNETEDAMTCTWSDSGIISHSVRPPEACVSISEVRSFVPISELDRFCDVSPFIEWARKDTPSYAQSSRRVNLKGHLKSKSWASKPADEPTKQQYKQHFDDIIQFTMRAVRSSGLAANVELSGDMDGWSIVLRPLGAGDCQLTEERLLRVAKEALLEASSQSRCIFLIGYCSPKPFTMQPQGFAATLGAMESPTAACWHIFKKGFCRHGDDCNKKHPVCKVPVQVLLESVQFDSPSTHLVRDFKQQVADLAMVVLATLKGSLHADTVEASKEKDDQGWKVEVVLKDSLMTHKEHMLSLAQEALFNATGTSKDVYILGYAAKPFVPKSHGFVTMLGNMRDEKKACWDLYAQGFCKRDCACCWEHPTCLTPVNVIVRGGYSQQLSFPANNSNVLTVSQRMVGAPSAFLQPR